jgi:hypothetical protein
VTWASSLARARVADHPHNREYRTKPERPASGAPPALIAGAISRSPVLLESDGDGDGYRGFMDGLDHDSDWTFLEMVDIPRDGSAEAARVEFLDRYPELQDKLDWLRIDLMCGRYGTSAGR